MMDRRIWISVMSCSPASCSTRPLEECHCCSSGAAGQAQGQMPQGVNIAGMPGACSC